MTHSATKGRYLTEALSNEVRALFHNSRIIGFACERHDGDGQQLDGGGLQMLSLLVASVRIFIPGRNVGDVSYRCEKCGGEAIRSVPRAV